MPVQHGFNFSQLNAKAPDLDLEISPSQEIQIAIRQVACEVARSVESRARFAAEQVGDESLRRQLRLVLVASRQPLTTQI